MKKILVSALLSICLLYSDFLVSNDTENAANLNFLETSDIVETNATRGLKKKNHSGIRQSAECLQLIRGSLSTSFDEEKDFPMGFSVNSAAGRGFKVKNSSFTLVSINQLLSTVGLSTMPVNPVNQITGSYVGPYLAVEGVLSADIVFDCPQSGRRPTITTGLHTDPLTAFPDSGENILGTDGFVITSIITQIRNASSNGFTVEVAIQAYGATFGDVITSLIKFVPSVEIDFLAITGKN